MHFTFWWKCDLFSLPKQLRQANYTSTFQNTNFPLFMPVPVAARSKAYVCGRSPTEIVVSNPTGAWIFVCCECCVLSGRGLCDELITRPEESYRLWCVVVCDLETLRMRNPWHALGRSATKKLPLFICFSLILVFYFSIYNLLRGFDDNPILNYFSPTY
jgi:hypothetical protein